jgi:hypothetical protein
LAPSQKIVQMNNSQEFVLVIHNWQGADQLIFHEVQCVRGQGLGVKAKGICGHNFVHLGVFYGPAV